jgi:hypothetical protein
MSVFDETAPAPPETIKFVQEVTGLFSHYSRVIDYTMAEAVTTIATTQAAPTEDTIKRVSHLLNYAASHPNNWKDSGRRQIKVGGRNIIMKDCIAQRLRASLRFNLCLR